MRENLDDVWLDRIWTYSILPYIEEHFFDDPDRVDDFTLAKLKDSVKPVGGDTGTSDDIARTAETPSPTAAEASESAAVPPEPVQDVPQEDPAP